jgi:ATP-dependent Zn protease
MTKSDKRLRMTAIHEAGHAVIAVNCGVRFRHVTIDPKADSLGRLAFNKRRKHVDYSTWTNEALQNQICIDYAGQIAARKSGQKRQSGLGRDNQDAAECAYQICSSSVEASAMLNWLYIRTENKLSDPKLWSAVERLAEELIKERTIRYKEASSIVLTAMRSCRASAT